MIESLNFLRPYLRGWPIIVVFMVAAFLTAKKYLSYVVPVYESTAKLRLADSDEGVPESNLFKDFDIFASSQKLNAEIEVIKSHTIITKALDNLSFDVQIFRVGKIRKSELYNDSPIFILPVEMTEVERNQTFSLSMINHGTFSISGEGVGTVKGKMGDTIQVGSSKIFVDINHALLKIRPDINLVDNYEFKIFSRRRLIEKIIGDLNVTPVDKEVPVVRISYRSANPEKAALLPNAIAEAYIDDYIQTKFSAADVTVGFLHERIKEISQQLGESELAILDYRNRKRITNIHQETETDLRKISQLKIQQVNLKMSLDAIRELETYIASGKDNFLDLAPNFEAFTDLLSTEIVKNIKALQAEKKDLLIEFTDRDERVKVVDEKIRDLTSYLTESISNTRKNLQVKYQNLSEDIARAEQVFIDVPEKERMITILNREFEIFQQSYNFLNQKKIEAEIARSATIAFHRVITPADISPEPVSPNYAIIKIVSTILGMMAALLLIFIVHAIKARVNNSETIESNSTIPLSGLIPKIQGQENKFQFFKQILTKWEVKELVKPGNILVFNGFSEKEGVGFIAKNLLKVLESQGRKTLLVSFNSNGDKSMTPVQKSDSIYEMAISTQQIRTFTTDQIQSAIHRAAENFEMTVVVNSYIHKDSYLAVMAIADCNFVVLDARLTPAKFIHDVDVIKSEFELPNVHFVLNRAGYNPSFLMEVFRFLQNKIFPLKTKAKTA